MLLSKIPRRCYTQVQTPIEKLNRLTHLLNGPNIFIKRDDLLGLTGGGNKTRKLEFLMADAIAKGADTIVTCGALQSNHCRLTLAAAVKEGLKCQLVLEEGVATTYDPNANGNNLLYKLLGAEEGYTIPTEGMIEAVQMLARTEGILLDPVYTGKVMAGLIELVRNETFKKGENVLFIHTGGSPSLYANHTLFNEDLFVLQG